MDLRDLFEEVQYISIRKTDIEEFCNDKKTIEYLKQKYNDIMDEQRPLKEFEEYLIEKEEYINKGKLMLLLYENYRESIEITDKQIKQIQKINGNDIINKRIIREKLAKQKIRRNVY